MGEDCKFGGKSPPAVSWLRRSGSGSRGGCGAWCRWWLACRFCCVPTWSACISEHRPTVDIDEPSLTSAATSSRGSDSRTKDSSRSDLRRRYHTSPSVLPSQWWFHAGAEGGGAQAPKSWLGPKFSRPPNCGLSSWISEFDVGCCMLHGSVLVPVGRFYPRDAVLALCLFVCLSVCL